MEVSIHEKALDDGGSRLAEKRRFGGCSSNGRDLRRVVAALDEPKRTPEVAF